jgi:ferredoxin-nitrite reductase
VAVAIVRVFIAHGDRTDRKRARLKYLLDAWGLERFLEAVAKELPFPLRRVPREACRPRGPVLKHGHVGIHPQRQPGLSYVGVVLPVGRLTVTQMRGLASVAERFGSGTLRLTVWQNLIVSDVADAALPALVAAVEALGLATAASTVRGALVACTGNTGCKFAATDTKGQALALAEHLERRVALDQPINIHLTGCPHSCAQHYVGDIGLLGATVEAGDDLVEGYAIVLGGGAGAARAIGREVYPAMPMAAVPERIERMLQAYLACRRDPRETFQEFTARHDLEALKRLFDSVRDRAA